MSFDNESKHLVERLSALKPSEVVSPNDNMYRGNDRHYFGVGRSAVLAMWTALQARVQYAGGDDVRTILDFGCGHGRVARYLSTAFADTRVEVTDFNRDGVGWCIANLGCFDMGDDIPSDYYDVIWLGSVLSHLPEAAAVKLLKRLKLGLRQLGVLIYTTQGRLSAAHLDGFVAGKADRFYMHYNMPITAAAEILSDFRSNGFGFRSYPRHEEYGIALGTLNWWAGKTLDDNLIQLTAQEAAWDTHQDVSAFVRVPSLLEVGKGIYY